MAQSDAQRKRAKAKAREEYRRQFEERRAKRSTKTVKVQAFDPEVFLDQVRLQSWATIHTIVYAAALTAVLFAVGHAFGLGGVGAIAALLAIGSVFYYLLYVWNLDLRELKRVAAVVGVFLSYFVAWLAMSFLISNPPFFDDAAPELRCCEVFKQNGSAWEQAGGQYLWNAGDSTWHYNLSAQANHVAFNASNGTARILFGAYDSGGVARVSLEIFQPNFSTKNVDVEVRSDGLYVYDMFSQPLGAYTFNVTAIDRAGHTTPGRLSLDLLP